MRFLLPVAALVSLFACARSEERAPTAQPQAVTTQMLAEECRRDDHQLLTLELSPEGLKVLSARAVSAPLPLLRVPEAHPWHLSVKNAEGRAVFEQDVPAQNQLRGEFAGPEGQTEGHHLLLAKSVFAARVPNVTGTLTLTVKRSTLSPEDPRAAGAGDSVEVGTVALTELSP